MAEFSDFMTMYPGGLRAYLAEWERSKKEGNMDLPHSTPIDMDTIQAPKPKSQFGNPVWGHDDMEASAEERLGRRMGVQEALRLMEGPAIMTNNQEFQTGLDAAIDVVKRRLAEL